jgi:hypothetical protein
MWPHRSGQNALDGIYFFLSQRESSGGQDDDGEQNRAGNEGSKRTSDHGHPRSAPNRVFGTTQPLRRSETADLAVRHQFSRNSRGMHILRGFFAAGAGQE